MLMHIVVQHHPTLCDGSFEQGLPLLEVGGVSSKQQSGARGRVLQTRHGLCHLCKQLQLLRKSLSNHRIFLAQPLCNTEQEPRIKK